MERARDIQNAFVQIENLAGELRHEVRQNEMGVVATSSPETKATTTSNTTGEVKTMKIRNYNFEMIKNAFFFSAYKNGYDRTVLQ